MFATRILLALALLSAGCASAPKVAILGSGRIREINIMTSPVGLNLDERPGVDGFSMKVFANDESNPKAVPIQEGAVEIMMFNGNFYGKTNVPAPAKTWHFEAAELKNYQVKSSIGAGYEFVLSWGTNHPMARLITVVARYNSPSGRSIFSPASSVTVLER